MNNDLDSKGLSYTAGFFMLVAFAIAAIVIASLIGGFVWTAMTGTPATEIEQGMLNPANSNAFKVMQVVLTLFGFLLPAFITAAVLNRRPVKLLGFTGKPLPKEIGIVLLITIVALFVSAGLSYINQIIPIDPALKEKFDKMEALYNKQVQAIVKLDTPVELIIAIIVMAFLPALCEETLFRGGLQNFLTRSTKMPVLSIIIVSLLFSAVHLSYYGFLVRFLLGVVLGLIYHYSGKIWLNILMHFLNNALAIVALYIEKNRGVPLEKAFSEKNPNWLGLLAIPVLVILLAWFHRITMKNRSDRGDMRTANEKLQHGL